MILNFNMFAYKLNIMYKLSILVFAVLFNAVAFTQHFSNQKQWIEQLQLSTVSLGKVSAQINSQTKASTNYYNIIGSGVIFYVPYKNQALPLLVTAKHVVVENNRALDSVRIRFSWHDNKSVLEHFGVPIPLKHHAQFTVCLPDDNTIDLACFPLISKYYDLKDSLKMMPYSVFPKDENYFEGADVFVLGYPGSVGNSYWTRALVRKGIISWMPSSEVSKRKFLVDCPVYPGNSGGPVFTRANDPYILTDTFDLNSFYKFLGIVVERRLNLNQVQMERGGILAPLRDTNNIAIYSTESIGVGVVEPAQNILQLLRKAELFYKKFNFDEYFIDAKL